MKAIRVGTRGSELAIVQTRWVSDQLRQLEPSLVFEEVVVQTRGDTESAQDSEGPHSVGAFVGALERALLDQHIDLAVHSHKDLPTTLTDGLTIAAIPIREVVHDVLVTKRLADWRRLPAGFRVGTGSPRRAAQIRQFAEVEIIPIRGNVPTRLAKLENEDLDGVILAAAGLMRLGLAPEYAIDLPIDRFVPAPGQGALAVQTRNPPRLVRQPTELRIDESLDRALGAIDHLATRLAVTAERAFLRMVGVGCRTPAAAHATVHKGIITLHAQLFSADLSRVVQGQAHAHDPSSVGQTLGERLLLEIGR